MVDPEQVPLNKPSFVEPNKSSVSPLWNLASPGPPFLLKDTHVPTRRHYPRPVIGIGFQRLPFNQCVS